MVIYQNLVTNMKVVDNSELVITREKCPNMEFFLVRISPHPFLYVFSPNALPLPANVKEIKLFIMRSNTVFYNIGPFIIAHSSLPFQSF